MTNPQILSDRLRNVTAVVVGGSAGSVEALTTVLPAIPSGYPGVIFVVVHVPRQRPSRLVELFGPLCSVDVQEADDKVPARGGSIYFAPPDYHLLIEAGPQLSLSVDEPVHFSRPSIDVLFESAAEVFGPRLLGILLSGASEDGSAGLGAIARAGGITAVQDPACAQSPLMVESALSRVRVDAVEDLHGLAGLLMTTTRYPRTLTKPELP